jgi:pimeloyl-ACP methyl ester carboxylesterase
MQAFTFRAGLGDAPCAQAPESGILIQTPEGAGQVTLNFNGVEIVLGSTVVLQGGDQVGSLELAQLEGTGMLPGYNGTLLGGQSWGFGLQEGAWAPTGDPQPLNSGRYAFLPLELLPREITIYERQVISSGSYAIVTRYFPPPPGVPPTGQSAILVHGRGLDWSSWTWLIPALQARGWGVLVPDMPGHGETGGQPNYGDWAGIIGDLMAYAQTRGFGTGVIFGASIGANAGLVACAGLPTWCQGTALFSPGIDFFGVQTLPVMPALGGRPALIITSENDTRGGPGDVARQIAGAGSNVTLQIYPGDLHGTFLADQYDLLEPIEAWLAGFP